MPCPHHTVVIDAPVDPISESTDFDALARALANLRWLSGRVTINTHILIAPVTNTKAASEGARIRIVTRATWVLTRTGVYIKDGTTGNDEEFTTELDLAATPTEIRNAIEEQQIAARAWLEKHRNDPTDAVDHAKVKDATIAAVEASSREGVRPLDEVSREDMAMVRLRRGE